MNSRQSMKCESTNKDMEDQYLSNKTMLEKKLNTEEQKLRALEKKLNFEEYKLTALLHGRTDHSNQKD